MFAFSQIQPETTGFVADMTVPISKYLDTSVTQGFHDSVFSNIWRWGQMQAEKGDTDHPMLTPEKANEVYPAEQPYTSPIRENVAQLIHDQHIAQMERNFYLSNDNHSMVAGAMGMGTSMLSSMLNPLDLSLMFFPVVGNAPLLGPLEREAIGSLGLGGRIREAMNTGLVTREALNAATRFPKLAESVIQGTAFMAVAEIPKQIVAEQYKEDAGNPIINIVSGAGFAVGMHGVFSVLGKVLSRIPAAAQQSMFEKAMDDFAKGKDVDVADLMKTTEAFAREQVELQQMLDDIEWNKTNAEEPNLKDIAAEPVTQESFQKKIAGIYNDAIQQLRGELLKPGEPPVVPATGPELAQLQYTSVLDEIRKRNLRTKAQIQEAFPENNLTREQAGALRRDAWNEQEVKVQQELNVEALLKKAQEERTNEMGAKRKARLQAERDMPNPIPPAEESAQAHDLIVPEDKTIAKVEEQAKEVEEVLKPKVKKPKAINPIESQAKAIGLVKQKGALGKKGYYTTTDPRFTGLSVIINEEGIHLNSIEVADAPKFTLDNPGYKTVELGDGVKAKLDPLGTKITYLDEKGNVVGKMNGFDLNDTTIAIADHGLDDSVRGHGYGEKAIREFAKLTGKVIASDEHPSAAATKMWDRLGATYEKRMIGDELQSRYYYSAEALGKGKGTGTEMIKNLQALADEMQKPLTLTAEALDKVVQPRLEAYYNKLGFEQVKGNEFVYEPKVKGQASIYHAGPNLKDTTHHYFGLKDFGYTSFGDTVHAFKKPKNVFAITEKNQKQVYQEAAKLAGATKDDIAYLAKDTADFWQNESEALLAYMDAHPEIDMLHNTLNDEFFASKAKVDKLEKGSSYNSAAFDKAIKSEEPMPNQSPIKNWELFNENIRDNLDSFSDARTSGKVNYTLMDIANEFVAFAKEHPELEINKALTEFRKTSDASKGNLTKLAKSVKDEYARLIEAEKPMPDAIKSAAACLGKTVI